MTKHSFDVKVFNPYASSNLTSKSLIAYHWHENQKCNSHVQHTREIDMTAFTSLDFSTTCRGMGPAMTAAVKRVLSHLAEKWSQPYQEGAGPEKWSEPYQGKRVLGLLAKKWRQT